MEKHERDRFERVVGQYRYLANHHGRNANSSNDVDRISANVFAIAYRDAADLLAWTLDEAAKAVPEVSV